MRRIKVGGRGSVFCPNCQSAPRGAAARTTTRKPTRKPRLHPAPASNARSDDPRNASWHKEIIA
jgi:hypothetical protein